MANAVYKIAYPNGKICVGMDLTGTLLYFGRHGSEPAGPLETARKRRQSVLSRPDGS